MKEVEKWEQRVNGKVAVQSYRDLNVWQRGIELATAIYRLTYDLPREEMYGLTAQLRRAAVSVPSNIAEGQGRLTTGEFRHFLGIARGSNFELQTQLEIARSLGLIHEKHIDAAESLSNEVSKMISAILATTKN